MPDTATSLGAAFAQAVTAKDYARIAELLHPEVDFRALAPILFCDAGAPESVEGILKRWIEPDEHVEELISVETDTVADRERVGYRYRLGTPDGHFLVEHQAFLGEREGRIGWLRLVCSGSRPV